VDPHSRTAVITLNVFRILPEDGILEEEYPLCVVARPVGRAAASLVVDGNVQALDLAGIDSVLSQFSNRTVDDWDIVDPPAAVRFKWRDAVSLDRHWNDNASHFMELWQDDAPQRVLDIGLWFDHLYILDAGLRPVTLPVLTEWRQRLKVAMDAAVGPGAGWSRAIPPASEPVPVARVLERLESA